MLCANIHCHTIEIYSYSRNKQFNFEISLKENEKNSSITKYSTTLYAIICRFCNNFIDDFKSNIKIELYKKNLFQRENFPASLFATEKGIKIVRIWNAKIFEFYEFDDSFLIGSKNEIISYIKTKYNSFKKKFMKLDSTNEENLKNIKIIQENLKFGQKEKNILKGENVRLSNHLEKLENNYLKKNLNLAKNKDEKLSNKLYNISQENRENVKKVLEQVENEKKINKELDSKISELQKLENNMDNINLKKYINEKEIKDLSNNNKLLEYNIQKLKIDLQLKENQIKETNNSLSNEKIIIQNLAKNLDKEKEKNKKLNDKLDNISLENSYNLRKVLEQVENEKKLNKNLKSKISELESQEKESNDKKDKLENQLRNKEKELEDVKKSIPENIGLKFKSDCQIGEYDIILVITSFKDLVNNGWIVKYKDGKKENYINYMNKDTIIVGVIGNGNKGKTFILEQLSGYKLKQGFNVKTEGLSIRYGRETNHIIAILDSAGQETPLLQMDKENNNKNIYNETDEYSKKDANDKTNVKEEKKINDEKDEKIGEKIQNKKLNDEPVNKEQKSEGEEFEFEIYSRDKLITEYFIQRFIIDKSDILILVVGNITLTEQKLLSRVKAEIKNRNSNKKIYVIHNLKNYSTDEQVNDYIENILKKLYKIEIKENIYQNIGSAEMIIKRMTINILINTSWKKMKK